MSSEEMEDYRRSIPLLKYNFILDTSLIHLVVTLPGKEEIILYRKGSCGCFPCLNGINEECESLEKFKEHPSFIQMVKRTFLVKGIKEGKPQVMKRMNSSWMRVREMNVMKCLLKWRHPSTHNKMI